MSQTPQSKPAGQATTDQGNTDQGNTDQGNTDRREMDQRKTDPPKTDQPSEERRRVNRDEGLKLLFAGAQDFARQEGSLAEGDRASFERSVLGRNSYTLRDDNDDLITRVPLRDARDMLRFRRQLARQLMVDAKVQPKGEKGQPLERRKVRLQKAEVRALSWAIGSGRRFPYPPRENREGLITLALLLCCVLPGLVYYVRVVLRNRSDYQTKLNELVNRWRLVGQPDPPPTFFAHYDLT
jgi:hypothetical protein